MTLVDLDVDREESEVHEFGVNDMLDLDDEDAETGLPRGRERPN